MTKTVALLVGSLRKDSINRRLAKALEKLAEGKLTFTEVNIGALPHYNEDLWENVPASVTELKQTVEAADAVLVVTPEYNRSFPGVIKNAMDWASRPYGKNSWSGKPAAATGTSGGAIASAVAQSHLKSELLNQNMVVMHQPEAYVQWKEEAFAADGSITDESIRKFLQAYVDAFARFVEKHG
ncbi:NADPH-dependent FMN reductase [Paracoccus laeviglucosivorans]|uniref:Chromate reductase n=1 Tax=Paracoccus laeviglucosivorans TaxID=1197861 RepID=A0A521C623_9RHOB|nr:NAD(P)H-dependent oxidoreductase [Paracoccus laeviglucosivorans]SMO54815.1 chromate reductase [Paracoccus laeviglucosivorans]